MMAIIFFFFFLMVFSFLPKKMCTLFQKMQFRICFLKMFRPLKGWLVCFILNNLHFPMVEGIGFYALIIPCVKQMAFVYL